VFAFAFAFIINGIVFAFAFAFAFIINVIVFAFAFVSIINIYY